MNSSDTYKAFWENFSPRELQPLYDMMPDISFFMKDADCRFVALNRLGCEFCGVQTERDAFGCTDMDFFPAQRAAEYMADDREVMVSGQPILNRVEPAPEQEESPRLVITNKIPVKDRTGRVIGIAGFSRRVEHARYETAVIRKLAAAVNILNSRFSEELTTEELAKTAGLSMSQFERLFRKTFNTSPRQYLQHIRIMHACRLLVETEETISAIAQQCGFYDHSHFTKAFVARKGMLPSVFRKGVYNV